jgi:alpha-tubulin suppressor-like RCC1 family protein
MADASRLKGGNLWPARTKNKVLYAWGANAQGQLGDGTVVNKSSPVQITATTDWAKIQGWGGGGIAVKTNGTMWVWGNGSGVQELGLNTNIQISSPQQIGAATNWASVAGGSQQNGAIKTTGTLWMWGTSQYGRIGDNVAGLSSSNSRSSPTQIGTGTSWSVLSLGGVLNGAIKTDGTIWMWGVNSGGQLGLDRSGPLDYVSSPTQVGTGTSWSTLAIGQGHTLAIKTDGTLWAWGSNSAGQLGDGLTYSRSSPTQVGSDSNWSSVHTQNFVSFAIRTNGTLWTFGQNNQGQLGINTATDRSTLSQVGALTNWSKVGGSGQTCIAVKTDNTIWSWGGGGNGTTGRNLNNQDFSSPVQIGTDADWFIPARTSNAQYAIRAS